MKLKKEIRELILDKENHTIRFKICLAIHRNEGTLKKWLKEDKLYTKDPDNILKIAKILSLKKSEIISN